MTLYSYYSVPTVRAIEFLPNQITGQMDYGAIKTWAEMPESTIV